jgi:hypothetical protein
MGESEKTELQKILESYERSIQASERKALACYQAKLAAEKSLSLYQQQRAECEEKRRKCEQILESTTILISEAKVLISEVKAQASLSQQLLNSDDSRIFKMLKIYEEKISQIYNVLIFLLKTGKHSDDDDMKTKLLNALTSHAIHGKVNIGVGTNLNSDGDLSAENVVGRDLNKNKR